MTYSGLPSYQNYVDNVYFWFLVGVLFRLPEIQESTPNLFPVPSARERARGGFQF